MTVEDFDSSLDLMSSLLWSYNEAENLQALIQKKQEWYDENHVGFWNSWITDVFDLRTANDFGLSVWSIILDIPLFGDSVPSPSDYPAFGFDTGEVPVTSPIKAFEFGNFATDARGSFGIPTEQKRLLLRLRYFQLVTRGAAPEINRFLRYLFGQNQIHTIGGLDMTITYIITGPVARDMLTLFRLFDVLPRPAGVELNFILANGPVFGFGEFNSNFDNSSFAED